MDRGRAAREQHNAFIRSIINADEIGDKQINWSLIKQLDPRRSVPTPTKVNDRHGKAPANLRESLDNLARISTIEPDVIWYRVHLSLTY
jgi:hypothetical protein